MDVTRRIKKLGREGKAREAVAELASMAKLGIQVRWLIEDNTGVGCPYVAKVGLLVV